MTNASVNKRKEKLKKEFQNAASSDKLLKALQKMESCFDEHDLGMEYLTLANKYLTDKSHENAVCFGKNALKILLKNQSNNIRVEILIDHGNEHYSCENAPSLLVSFVLVLLGSASLNLNKYDECVSYLNWCIRCLSKLGGSSCGGERVLVILIRTHLKLYEANVAMGKSEEAIVHAIKVLEFKERIMEEGCIELGRANKVVYESYLSVMGCKEALPYCVKALGICVEHSGSESVEADRIMRDLVIIYKDLGKYEKALQQSRLLHNIMKKKKSTICSTELLRAETEIGNLLIELGRCGEAVDVFNSVISQAPTEGCERGIALVSLATAFCDLNKFSDAKQLMETTCNILKKKGMDPIAVAIAFGHMTRLYEKMGYFENAISLLRKVMAMPELPEELLAEGFERLISLVSSTRKEKEVIQSPKKVTTQSKDGEDLCAKIISGNAKLIK